jgi:hypothetical protein
VNLGTIFKVSLDAMGLNFNEDNMKESTQLSMAKNMQEFSELQRLKSDKKARRDAAKLLTQLAPEEVQMKTPQGGVSSYGIQDNLGSVYGEQYEFQKKQ